MSNSLALSGVVVDMGATRILDGVDLEIAERSIVAVVGANGAGKTTLLDVISGVVGESAGTVAVGGAPCAPAARRSRVGRVFQGSPMPETLTVGEVAALATRDRAATAQLLDRFGLSPHATSFVAELSTGMRRILDLAIATVERPNVLLLDEPASGLAQSEIDHLAGVVKSVRDETGCAVIVVEHDASLVHALADEVVVLEAGKVVARGSVDDVLAASHARTRPRIHAPNEDRFQGALARVEAGASRAAALPMRTLSKWTLLRLGLREMSAGLASVLIINVLTRVLHVERGINLIVVTAIVASYNLAAPLAVAIGHRSDTHPIFGRRRSPYIVIGAAITALAVAGAPHVAGRLAGHVTIGAVALSVLLFVAMGLGMSGAGSVFLALLADLSEPNERGHVASVVYMELMVGVLMGVALTEATLKNGTQHLGTLFGVAGVLVFAMSVVAVWGHEARIEPSASGAPDAPAEAAPTLRDSLRTIAAIPQARLFFVFISFAMLFLFLQGSILSSFGGDVLHLSVRATGNFSGIMTIGTIAGMVIAGRPFAEQLGHRRVSVIGLVVSVAGFGGLALAASARAVPPVWFAILILGFGSGLFTVSTLALMMGMSDRRRTALFMGAWTLARALADGGANAGGGVLAVFGRHVFHSASAGYAMVFGIEAVGLALCLPILLKVNPSSFVAETGETIPIAPPGPAGAIAGFVPAPAGLVAEELAPADLVTEGLPAAPATAPVASKRAPAQPKRARAATSTAAARKAAASNGSAPRKASASRKAARGTARTTVTKEAVEPAPKAAKPRAKTAAKKPAKVAKR
jgi:BCD family chlorophyll transporter-like MFS transporter